MKNYLECKLSGGKVHSQKQFLENDRKVLKLNAKYDGFNYFIHYFLADDTVEIREIHFNNRLLLIFIYFLFFGAMLLMPSVCVTTVHGCSLYILV
mgnify:CR=1 FL=1